MAELEQELLSLVAQLRSWPGTAELGEIRRIVQGLATRVDELDPHTDEPQPLRLLYRYVDARSKAAALSHSAALDKEYSDIEQELLIAIASFRRSERPRELTWSDITLHELRERVGAFEPGSGKQWALAQLYNYGFHQRRIAQRRVRDRPSAQPRRSRSVAPTLDSHAPPPPRFLDRGKSRDQGIGR
ncbi:hypothetical protein AB0C65_35570 [Nocardia sp. NPDC048505]|uniref:hypothetical protein n=1 Tax=Nocardia sp. NPDC048505 TaxID=3155756 RepID=UPI0033D05EDA